MVKLVITDLDDTLYSWIGFFIPAFYEMVQEVSSLINVPQEELLKEYKAIHQEMRSVEYPYATINIPSVRKKYVGYTEQEIKKELDSAFYKFNYTRKKLLKLYAGVEDTLNYLYENNILVVGYTESAEENGFYRLKKLGIDNYFKEVYVSDSFFKRPDEIPASPKTHIVCGKKPNADVLRAICDNESISISEALYIGDSLSKDMLMAKHAGMISIWCNYPKPDIQVLYNKLVDISHWTTQDFKDEEQYKNEWKENKYTPDYTIQSFKECKQIISAMNNV